MCVNRKVFFNAYNKCADHAVHHTRLISCCYLLFVKYNVCSGKESLSLSILK